MTPIAATLSGKCSTPVRSPSAFRFWPFWIFPRPPTPIVLSTITDCMPFEQAVAETLGLFPEHLAQSFQTEPTFLFFSDIDLECIFLCRLKSGQTERLSPESFALARADGLNLDEMDAAMCL